MGRIIDLIIQDCRRYEDYKGLSSVIKRFLLYPSFRLLCLYRLLSVTDMGGVFLFLYRRLSYKYMIDIPVTVKIGGGLLMPHGGPIVINLNSEIGKNCTIHPCTLVGGQRGKGVPIIGDNVFIGHGAKIIGNVKVSDWTFICPNSVIVKDTEENTTISGIPAKVLNHEGRKNVELYL